MEKKIAKTGLGKHLAKKAGKATVNVGRIAKHTVKGDLAVVPGKVLGAGAIGHKVTVAALGFSASALKKIKGAGGKAIRIEELDSTKGAKIIG